jgi:hypothetical protein
MTTTKPAEPGASALAHECRPYGAHGEDAAVAPLSIPQGWYSSSPGCSPGRSAALIGLGNIGGFAAGLLGRLPDLAQLTLLDRDTYEAKNLVSQDIAAADVGRPKAVVQAERLRRINAGLRVAALVEDLEQVPLGLLRADIILACLDSRRARQCVNQAAWRLGIPWIDAGVRADGLLARVNVYRPGAGQPCLECAWDQRDYELIEQTYPCRGNAPVDEPALAPTNAPASLGALAAALQVLECQKVFAGEWQRAAVSKQLLIDAAAHRHFVTSYRPNPACRFDHALWQIDGLERRARQLSVGDTLALAGRDPAAGAALRVEGQVFVRKLVCPRCGDARALPWRLSGRLGAEQQCVRCQRRMLAPGTDVREWLDESDLLRPALADPLSNLGIRDGDVFTLRGADGDRHIQLAAMRGDRAQPARPQAGAAWGLRVAAVTSG